KLDHWKDISQKLSRARIPEETAKQYAKEGKAVIWIDGGLHATETVNAQEFPEMIYQMASRTDEETMRFLDDIVLLMPLCNPDGMELVSNWYMRNADPLQREMNNLPRLYHKYVGHDNNRDALMFNLSETINMGRQLFIEWNPQIMYNTHQPGPDSGYIVFVPPFRDPFNYDLDPLIPMGIEQVGTAMQARLIAKNMPGTGMRDASSYSTWYNGAMRTSPYYRNQIGILTEIQGGPTPIVLPVIANYQLPSSNWPMPVAPGQTWHQRQSIDYVVELSRAVLDYASRNREILLSNIYTMGRRSIEKGSRDNWTPWPPDVAAMAAAAEKERAGNASAGR